MQRWVLIILLLVYPFQVALAMADKCCALTPAGVTHHSAEQAPGETIVQAVFLADDGAAALSDPHCAACSFGHGFYLPAAPLILPAEAHRELGNAFLPPVLTSPPVVRLERPKWAAAAC
jgi:hypothetical protein